MLAPDTAVDPWEAFDAFTREHFSSFQGPRHNRLSRCFTLREGQDST